MIEINFFNDYVKALDCEWSEVETENEQCLTIYKKLIQQLSDTLDCNTEKPFIIDEKEVFLGKDVFKELNEKLCLILYRISVISIESQMYFEAEMYLNQLSNLTEQIAKECGENWQCYLFFQIGIERFYSHLYKLKNNYDKCLIHVDKVISLYHKHTKILQEKSFDQSKNSDGFITDPKLIDLIFVQPSIVANRVHDKNEVNPDPVVVEYTEREIVELAYSNALEIAAYCFEKTGEADKAAKYCVMNLNYAWKRNQENFNTRQWSNYYDWIINCAELSNFYHNNNRLSEMNQCLSISTAILSDFNQEIKSSCGDEKYNTLKSNINQGFLILVFEIIKELSSKPTEQINRDNVLFIFNFYENHDIVEKYRQMIQTFHLKSSKEYESKIKHLFIAALTIKKEIQSFYTLEDFCHHYIDSDQFMSKIYKYLASNTNDKSKKCKLHKRRVDMYELYAQELNPSYFLNLSRELFFEMGEIYSAMTILKWKMIIESIQEKQTVKCDYLSIDADIIEKKFFTNENVNKSNKINKYSKKCVKYFQLFIKSYVINPLENLPVGNDIKKYDERDERHVLLAYFHMGLIIIKQIYGDLNLQIQKLQLGKRYYTFFMTYCDMYGNNAGNGPFYEENKHTGEIRSMNDEYKACVDSLDSLSIRISRISAKLTQ